jgi:hypothetical protein
MKRKNLLVGAAFTAMALSSAANAAGPAPLAPGGTVAVPDFVATFNRELAEKTVSFGPAPDSIGPAGSLTELVVSGSTANPYGVNDLAFAYQFTLTGGNVASMSLPGFGSFSTAVKTCNITPCIFGTGVVPEFASRSADGDTVTALFSPAVTPADGATGAFDIFTNATAFVDPTGVFTDSLGNVSMVSTFGPTAAVPEPSAWATMLVGLGGLGLVMRRRAGRKQASVLVTA